MAELEDLQGRLDRAEARLQAQLDRIGELERREGAKNAALEELLAALREFLGTLPT
jgi:hypothetical protein